MVVFNYTFPFWVVFVFFVVYFLLCIRVSEVNYDWHMVSKTLVTVVVTQVAFSLDLNLVGWLVEVDHLIDNLTLLCILADDIC